MDLEKAAIYITTNANKQFSNIEFKIILTYNARAILTNNIAGISVYSFYESINLFYTILYFGLQLMSNILIDTFDPNIMHENDCILGF